MILNTETQRHRVFPSLRMRRRHENSVPRCFCVSVFSSIITTYPLYLFKKHKGSITEVGEV